MSEKQTLPITLGPTNYKENIFEILKILRPSWQRNSVDFREFNEGITNQLIGCYERSKQDEMLLVRIYGENTEIMIDRQMECFSMQLLHSMDMAAPIYCTFDNGMCYGYQVGKPLDIDSIRNPKIRKLIAKEMARLHSIKAENVKEPEMRSTLFNGKEVFYEKSKNFLSFLPKSFEDPEKQERFVSRISSQFNLKQELNDLCEHLKRCCLPIVLCHNDLLVKNIIYNEKTDKITFIDFEYTGLNNIAFDIANHFCEYAGIDQVDYKLYPDKEYQLNWLKNYLEFSRSFEESTKEIGKKDVEYLYIWVQKFSLASHFFWGIWAIIQAKYSTINFDFLGYAIMRLDEFKQRKEKIFQLELPIESTFFS